MPDDFRKVNAILRYVMPVGDGKLGFTAMAYDGKWNSTDQVAQRAVDEGLIGRYGTLDASDGGTSSRYSLSVDYSAPLAGGQFQTTAYWFKYRLNLFSNFTYFLDDPVNGDQFEQADDRNVLGWTGSWTKSARALRRADAQHARLRVAAGPDHVRSGCMRRANASGCRPRAKTT